MLRSSWDEPGAASPPKRPLSGGAVVLTVGSRSLRHNAATRRRPLRQAAGGSRAAADEGRRRAVSTAFNRMLHQSPQPDAVRIASRRHTPAAFETRQHRNGRGAAAEASPRARVHVWRAASGLARSRAQRRRLRHEDRRALSHVATCRSAPSAASPIAMQTAAVGLIARKAQARHEHRYRRRTPRHVFRLGR